MINKINIYLLTLKIKFILLTLVVLSLFVQLINLLEVSRVIESSNNNFYSIIYLSLLKLPTTIQEILPFVIIISTAFFYRHLISNNEFISMRNIGYSILDIYKPVGLAIFLTSIIVLILLNPLSSIYEKKFESATTNRSPELYSIKIKNDEVWIKNKDKNKINYINFSNFDLKNMSAEKIKIIEVDNLKKKFFLANKGRLSDKKLILQEVNYFDINKEEINKINNLSLSVNFNNNDIVNSITYYKHIPFYFYKKHIDSLKKFNLYSQEISLFYLSEVLKPILLVILGFIVMGFASKFKRNENFFKILFISILIGFIFFLLNEVLSALTLANFFSFWFAYAILISASLIIGLYRSINIEVD